MENESFLVYFTGKRKPNFTIREARGPEEGGHWSVGPVLPALRAGVVGVWRSGAHLDQLAGEAGCRIAVPPGRPGHLQPLLRPRAGAGNGSNVMVRE